MLHQNSTANHKLENWTYADAAARTAATGFVTADLNKIAFQTDTGGYYRLTATTPTWSAIASGTGDVVGPASVTDDLPAIFNGVTGKLIKSKTYAAFKALLLLVKGDVGLGSVTNDAQLKASDLDTDGTLAANSDTKIASQKAVKTYVDAHVGGGSGTVTHAGAALTAHRVVVGNGTDDVEVIAATGTPGQYLRSGGSAADPAMATPTPTEVGLGNVTNDAQLKAADLDTDGTLAANSASKIPAQSAVVTYVAAAIAAVRAGVSSAFDTLAEIATELGLKAPLASPALTGTPTAPTASVATNTTQIATTAFVLANAGGTFATLDNETRARLNLAILR